jgi:hypothetical protein
MDVSGQLHDPAALPPGKDPLVPTGQEAGWAPEPFWTRWFREKFRVPAGNRTPEPWTLEKEGGKVRTGFIWLIIETSGGLLRTR